MTPTTIVRALFSLAAAALLTAAPAHASPADPTDGGKGGRIVRVTTLAKDGPGSLAEALATKGPRIIVFEVGGAIDLERSTLEISEPFVTIAGHHPAARRDRRADPRRENQPLARAQRRRRPGADERLGSRQLLHRRRA